MALAGRSAAWLARETGLSTSTVSDYAKGAMPSADRAFAIAEVLGVRAQWLIRGDGPRSADPEAPNEDWVMLPRYDLFDFDGEGMPAPVEQVPVRRSDLVMAARSVAGLWLAEMPSDAMPDIAREGGVILCRDPDVPLSDGRVYAFMLDGRPIVRRVQVRPEGLVLKAGDPNIDPITLTPEQLEQLVPIGRVLAAFSLQPV